MDAAGDAGEDLGGLRLCLFARAAQGHGALLSLAWARTGQVVFEPPGPLTAAREVTFHC